MNKQTERLISADKLLNWMETNYDRFESRNDFFEGIRTAILNDLFSLDPVPLPTLKPVMDKEATE